MSNYIDKFSNPPAEFRGAPFWAWNCKLDKQTLLKQIDYFKEMGMGGFTMHCRVGLDTEYLGEEFMDIVKACVTKAKALKMKAYLYDEDRWPPVRAAARLPKTRATAAEGLFFRRMKEKAEAYWRYMRSSFRADT